MGEAALELVERPAQRVLRGDAGEAGVVDEREEHVAELVLALLRRRAAFDEAAQLGDLFLDLLPRAGRLGKVEPDAGGFLLDALRAEQRRQLTRHAVERGAARLSTPGALLLLDLLPVAQHLAGAGNLRLAEDVRVAADELFHLEADHVFERERAGRRLRDLGVEDDVEQQVAELALELVPVPLVDGIDGLVGLFDEEVLDGLVRLLAVPRAVTPETADDGDEVGVEVGDGGGAVFGREAEGGGIQGFGGWVSGVEKIPGMPRRRPHRAAGLGTGRRDFFDALCHAAVTVDN